VEQATVTQPSSAAEKVIGQPTEYYPPSLIDRFLAAVDRLPAPYWVTFLVLFVLEVAILHVIAWLTGSMPPLNFEPVLMIFPIYFWFPLAVIRYLNGFARQIVRSFCALLDGEQGITDRLEYEFTVMPVRPVVINGLLWFVLYLILWVVYYQAVLAIWSYQPIMFAVIIIVGLFSFVFGSAIYYHAIRQLRLVNRSLELVKTLNMFQLDPIYAFSRLTARIGISWLILLSAMMLIMSLRLTGPLIFGLYGIQAVMALAAFMLPLWNIHTRLENEKHTLEAAANQRLKQILQRFHSRLESEDLASIGEFKDALEAISTEQQMLAKIHTWPWRGETLRVFISALLLPVVLILVQLGLEFWFGRFSGP
jgi:hypothetical protein